MVLLQVRSGGLTLRQSPEGEARPYGLYVGRDGFNGWDDGPTMRAEAASRPQSHGDFDMPGYLAGRLMPIEGWAIAPSRTELEHLRDRFIGHGADGTKFRVAVERNDRTLWADARIAASTQPTFKDVGTGRRARWSTTWWFPDPRKYGELNTFGPATALQVIHRGNFPALPVLHITGTAAGGYTINGPSGRQIIVTRALAAGVEHEFDMRTGRLSVGGVRVLGGIARADLFSIPPGLPATAISVSAGLLTADITDTFA